MQFKKPSKTFIEIAKVWHEDEQLNHDTGFGRGPVGVNLAHQKLDLVLDSLDIIRFFAVWDGLVPIGYVAFTELDEKNKAGVLHITISPTEQGKGYGSKALQAAVDLGMRDGLYRITYSPVTANKRAVKAGFNAGFKLEARTKFSVWTEDGPQDQAQMRVIKPEWRKRNHT